MIETISGRQTKVLFDEKAIAHRIKSLAEEISRDLNGEPIVLVGVLKGAVVFLTDLMRAMPGEISIDFISAQSYEGTASTGRVRINHDLTTDIEGKNVVVVEDIIDTGQTMKYLLDTFQLRKPKSLKVCVLLSKPEAHQVACPIDYCGFEISKEFVVGYGLDLDGAYRNLPYILQILD